MERTFFTAFCRLNNLIATLSDPMAPHFLRPLLHSIGVATGSNIAWEAFESQQNLKDSETFDAPDRLQSEDTTLLSLTIYEALLERLASDPHLSEYTHYRSIQSPTDPDTPVLSRNARVDHGITHRGRRFSDANHSVGNSNIMFYSRHRGRETCKSFGQIHRIFSHKRRLRSGKVLQQTFIAVNVHPPLPPTDVHLDPYKDLEGIGARLVCTVPISRAVVITLDEVICHIAICPFRSASSASGSLSSPCSVVIALDEVSTLGIPTHGVVSQD